MIAKSIGVFLVILGVVGLGASLIDWSTLEGQWASEETEKIDPIEKDETPSEITAVTESDVVDDLPIPADDTEQLVANVPESAPVDDTEPTPVDDVEKIIQPAEQKRVPTTAKADSGSVKVFDRNDQASPDTLPWVDIEAGNESFSEDSEHANFILTLSEPVERPIIIIFSTIDGSARSNEDYLGQRGTVTFKPGIVSAEILTPLVDDEVSESDEQFVMVLNGAPGIVNLKNRRAKAIIKDND